MIHNTRKLIKNWRSEHKNYLWFISGASIASFAGAITYAVLPVVIGLQYGEERAGLIIGIFALFQALLADPIAGGLSDRIGSRKVVMLGFLFGILAGIVWLTLPIQNIFVLIPFAFLLYLSYGFRATSESYILRTAKKDEGGILFGLFGNISALAVFLATISLPFFVISGREYLSAWVLIAIYTIGLIILYRLPNEKNLSSKKINLKTLVNPLPALKKGWRFVRANKNYPLLSLGATLFEGIFYGTIWFVFPLHLAHVGLANGENSLHLGVYDLVTTLFAGYAGYLADKYNWKHIHSLGWIFVIIGLLALPFYGWPTWLIIVGLIIAIGNNLSYYAAAHALEANDVNHADDGSFIGIRNITSSIGYAIAPLMSGILYARYGFTTSLGVSSILCAIIAVFMIVLTWRLENKESKQK